MSTCRSRFGEQELVSLLRKRFDTRHPAVRLGIGDDAAVLHRVPGDTVCSVDVNVEGVHFDRRWLSLQDIGFRSMQAALSDLAAMGAQPSAALSAWIVPPNWGRVQSEQLAQGQRQSSLASNCPIVGGNVSKGGELSVTTTVLGYLTKPPLRRDNACPGEELWLLGEVGCAAAGLGALRYWSGHGAKRRHSSVLHCVQSWRRPRALLAEGLGLAGCASAAVDISDGLAEDVRQLAAASEVRIIVDERLLRRTFSAALLGASRQLRGSALRRALYGGEDYALLATGPHRLRPLGAQVIGRVRPGRGAFLQSAEQLHSLGGGFDHLAR